MSIFASAHKNCKEARDVYKSFVFASLLPMEGPIALAMRTAVAIKTTAQFADAWCTDHIPEFIGEELGSRTTKRIIKPVVRSNFIETFGVENWRKERKPTQGMRKMTANDLDSGRVQDLTKFKTRIDRMVIILHNADKAGMHVDIHIGNLSIIKKLPKDFEISRTKNGELTEATKERVKTLVATEFKARARLAQNLDHSYDDAKFQWNKRTKGPTGYGAGEYRLIVDDSPIYVYSGEHALHVSAPHLVNNKILYVYRLGTTDKNKVPILSIGVKHHDQISVPDKLHLSLESRKEAFIEKVGSKGDITIKYDGASGWLHLSPKGVILSSPRISKKDGNRIEYNAKVLGLEKTELPNRHILVQGELLYLDQKGKYLKAHEVGGILNGKNLPTKVTPEFRIYRLAKIDNRNYQFKSQEEHREHLKEIVSLNPKLFKLPQKVSIGQLNKIKNVEGFVGIPEGSTIEQGIKYKSRGDTYDWQVESIDFKPGKSGRIAGVVWFKSLESGKRFKMGASSLGSDDEVNEIWKSKRDYIGRVAKVACFKGHEGRASKFVDWHLDKGIG